LQKNVQVHARDFFKEPFTREEIKVLLQGRPAAEMFSFKSPGFKVLGLNPEKLKENDLIDLMLKEPRLIRRPVIRMGRHVYFGADVNVLAKILKSDG